MRLSDREGWTHTCFTNMIVEERAKFRFYDGFLGASTEESLLVYPIGHVERNERHGDPTR